MNYVLCYIETFTRQGFCQRILQFIFFTPVPRFFEVPCYRSITQSLRDQISISLL
jgi:hypothetical protein